MFPRTVCALLNDLGHDAVHVRDLGLDACPDIEVAAAAVRARRVLVTENVKDFAGERELTVVCVLKSRLRGAGMAHRLADLLDEWAQKEWAQKEWAQKEPEPYVGLHWPP